MPKSKEFENSIFESFERYIDDNSIIDPSHIWNKVQSQVILNLNKPLVGNF